MYCRTAVCRPTRASCTKPHNAPTADPPITGRLPIKRVAAAHPGPPRVDVHVDAPCGERLGLPVVPVVLSCVVVGGACVAVAVLLGDGLWQRGRVGGRACRLSRAHPAGVGHVHRSSRLRSATRVNRTPVRGRRSNDIPTHRPATHTAPFGVGRTAGDVSSDGVCRTVVCHWQHRPSCAASSVMCRTV